MNIINFTKNLESIQKSLFSSEFLSETKRSTFSDEKLAMILTEIAKVSVQTALNLEELEQKERTLALTEERTRQEVETAALNAQIQNKLAVIEAIKGLIQAHAMARASGDNANINKANAYNALLNIAANAENAAMVQQHINNVIKTINGIDTSAVKQYDELLNSLKNATLDLAEGLNTKEVMVYAPKVELEVGETMKLMGFSTYGENPCEFEINGITTEGKTTYFTAGEEGEVEVSFRAQNKRGEWISDTLRLTINKTEFQKLELRSIYDRA